MEGDQQLPILETYQIIRKIGKGSYGIIYEAIHDQQRIALKRIIFKKDEIEHGIPTSLLRQTALLMHLNHPNIIKLHKVIGSGTTYYMVMDLMHIDLSQYILTFKPSVDTIKRFMHDILKGVEHCHMNRIMHRDIKPANILLDIQDGMVKSLKLSDFGLSRHYSIPFDCYSTQVVTLWYRAPELLIGERIYTPAVDIWSVGCIFGEMINKRPLFQGQNQIGVILAIMEKAQWKIQSGWSSNVIKCFGDMIKSKQQSKISRSIEKRVDNDGLNLLEKLLCMQPEKRITATQALHHPYFKYL